MSLEAVAAVKANHTTGRAQERLILLILAGYNTSKRSPYYVYPGLARIASDANMSVRQASTWIKRLCEKGFLFGVRKGPHPNAYFILLSPDGDKLDMQPDFRSYDDPGEDMHTDFRSDMTEDMHTDFRSGVQKIGSVAQKIGSVGAKDRKYFDPLIRNLKEEEKEEEKEDASTYPQSQNGHGRIPQVDRMSSDRWRQMLERISLREHIGVTRMQDLRRGKLELYPAESRAFVIVPSNSELYASRHQALIELHLPVVTGQHWSVDIWTAAEIAAAEQEIMA